MGKSKADETPANDDAMAKINAEIEAGREAALAKKDAPAPVDPAGEDGQTGIDVKGTIEYLSLDDVDFDSKWNIRDTSLQPARVARKIAELSTDLYIRTPLVVCVMPDGSKRGACGYLRFAALWWMREHDPVMFAKYFEGKIPFKVVVDATERDRELLMYDHGLEEDLDESEVYKAQKRLMRMGCYTQKDMISILAKMYYKLSGTDERRRYNERLKDLTENGMTLVGSTKIKTVADARLATFRGRFQYFQRIAQAPGTCVEEHFLKQCRGEKVAKITFQAAIEIEKCKSEAEAREYLDALAGKQAKGESSVRTWSKGKLEQVNGVTKSTYLKRQLEAALGDEVAAASLPVIEDELLLIEKAKGFDPDAFWSFINAQCLKAAAVAPAAVPTEA